MEIPDTPAIRATSIWGRTVNYGVAPTSAGDRVSIILKGILLGETADAELYSSGCRGRARGMKVFYKGELRWDVTVVGCGYVGLVTATAWRASAYGARVEKDQRAEGPEGTALPDLRAWATGADAGTLRGRLAAIHG